MKRVLLIIISFFVTYSISAQVESMEENLPDFESHRYKNFDGFILDMGPMMDIPSYLAPPTLSFRPFDFMASESYILNPDAIKINPNFQYLGNVMLGFSSYSAMYPGGSNVLWQGASFKLKNGVRINTYGEYNADGYKVYNPTAMPWEKNKFNAAFEVKSPNGKFGIKVEVQGGRNYPY